MRSSLRSHVDAVSSLIAAAVASVFSTACSSSGKTALGPSDASGDATGEAASETDTGMDAPGEIDATQDAPGEGDAGQDAPSCVTGHGPIVSATPGQLDASPDAWVLWTVTFAVNPACCAGQLKTASVYSPLAAGPNVDAGPCDYTVENPCASAPDGSIDCNDWCLTGAPPQTQAGCGRCEVVGTDGDAGVIGDCLGACGSACGFGRPPRGFVAKRVRSSSALGAKLAHMAQLEAASVVAFDALHADLKRLGAPRSLLRAVRRARRDEVRHARLATDAAARAGVTVPPTDVAPIGRRALEKLAIDNAEEGCVRETFGAALVAVQAERARHPALRRMMRAIASDELRHAALSWDIARWLDGRLDRQGRERVCRARKTAVGALSKELRATFPADVSLGMPDSASQHRLFQAMQIAFERGVRAASSCPSA
jgi:hypothetical protein